jgi:cytochrome c oxidase subunit 2
MSTQFAFFPDSASSTAPHVDGLTLILLATTGGMLFAVFALIAFFGIRYRKGSPHSRAIHWKGKHALEWGWTFGSLVIFLGLFVLGTLVYFEQHAPPLGSGEIMVIGKQWMWKFQHPDGTRELNELHVPIGKPILLTMTSQDVIHSFFVPEFRIKQDVLPDRYTKTWFQVTKPGTYHLFCTQYCGTMHSEMRGQIIALTPENYQKWLESGISSGSALGTLTMASRGRELFTKLGCISCHGNTHGSNLGVQAPSLAGIFGKEVGLSDGTTVLADENYIRESILNPRAKIVQGYPNIMPSFAQQVSEEDLLDLIAYIKSQKARPEGGL